LCSKLLPKLICWGEKELVRVAEIAKFVVFAESHVLVLGIGLQCKGVRLSIRQTCHLFSLYQQGDSQ